MEQQENLIKRLQILPNNLIIVGPKYSGKKTLVNEITKDFYWAEGKVDVIRQLTRGNFVFADVDDWSPACFSAMLKLLEENEDHIIITCKNIMNLPRSIQSRCIIERMEPYKNIGHFCDNIGQMQYVSEDMIKSAKKCIYNEEFDLDVYFSVLCNIWLEEVKKNPTDENKLKFLICSRYNSAKNLKSLNKKQFILCWQLDIAGKSENYNKL